MPTSRQRPTPQPARMFAAAGGAAIPVTATPSDAKAPAEAEPASGPAAPASAATAAQPVAAARGREPALAEG